MSSARRVLGVVFRWMGLLPLYFRLVEWRLSRTAPPPPPFDESGVPIPPRLLITQVAGEPDWRGFLKNGADNVASLFLFAGEAGVDLAGASRILDFGCGCGRVIRHLPRHTRAALYGVDYNPKLIEWCAANLTGNFARNQLTPPLDFPEAHFDAIYLLSVFTHLRWKTQVSWLEEFARVTRPGGAVLVTFHDEDHPALETFDGGRGELERNGFFIANDSSEGSNLIATFQSRVWSSALFAQHFDVVRIVSPRDNGLGQTLAILRRRDAPASIHNAGVGRQTKRG